MQGDYPEYKKESRFHVALQYQNAGRNEEGNNATPPHPKGISGGGLWAIHDVTSPQEPLLEGIAIEFFKAKALCFSTKIEHVIAFVHEHLPPSA
ncbi:hypothetical protein LRS03_26035 [Rhizobacter sp. J219]|uniref:hypothetical protein n=1 Tax=Rhizobacter sp. J219 TaxID=2898430 RepID=UPI002151FC99|nr:hypothetical protein [Rhizobacter sp. J219]MCR5886126.1 hypothetical protein [Rhizobacter sp. J219]